MTPAPHPRPDLPPAPDAAAEALRRRRAERAALALVSPWSPRRAKRVRIVALLLVIVGPLLGTLFALVLVPGGSGDVATAEAPDAQLRAEATLRGIDATNGEMAVRLVLSEGPAGAGDLFADGGVLADDLSIVVNDATGSSLHELEEGQRPGSLTVTVDLDGSRVTRYPLDRYRATVFVRALRGGPDGQPVPTTLTVQSNDPLFTARPHESMARDGTAVAQLTVQRRWTVVGWAAFFVLLCWLLAISSASLGWTTVVHGIAQPGWSLGFLIGVLFALPPLRAALPGNPQSGALVDFAAFYWAVGIVALTLVALVLSWNMRVRRSPHEPDAPPPPPRAG